MDKDERITCTDCVNWKFSKMSLEYFGSITDCINCPCNKCSCYDPTSTRRFETRPLFIRKIVVT